MCTEVRRPPEVATLPAGAHPASPILHHTAEHDTLISLTWGIDDEVKDTALCYGTHASVVKETEFIHTELSEQVQAGHVAVFPLEVVNCGSPQSR